MRRAGGVLEVFLAMPLSRPREAIAEMAEGLGIEVHRVGSDEMDLLCGAVPHQGAAASLREFAYRDLQDVAARRSDLLVAADGIEDPRNLGALIRGIAAAGAGGLIIPRDRAAEVTPITEKTAAGVTSWFPVVRVVNLARALEQAKRDFGYWAVALAADGDQSLFGPDLPSPTILVVGGEDGLRPLVRRVCDVTARIPMAEGVESLNVAVAAAVACFELRRRLG